MYKVEVIIEGVAPILFNRFTAEALEGLDKKVTGGTKTKEGKLAEARAKAYTNSNGVYWPGVNLKQTIIQGASKASLKHGKKALWPFLQAALFIQPMELEFGKKESDFIDERWGRIPPKTGAAAIIRRPGMHTGWNLRLTLVVVDERIQASQVKTAVEEAGLLVGTGSYRPEFGRFKVVEWKEVNNLA